MSSGLDTIRWLGRIGKLIDSYIEESKFVDREKAKEDIEAALEAGFAAAQSYLDTKKRQRERKEAEGRGLPMGGPR